MARLMQLTPDLLEGIVIGLLTAFLWGFSTNIYKSQSDEATPLAITALKMWLAFLFMLALVLLPFRITPFYVPFDSIVFLSLSVTMGLVVGDFVYLMSQERIGVSYAYPIANVFPIITYVLAIFMVAEEVLALRFVGIIVAIAGVGLISYEQGESEGEENLKDMVGIGLALFAALCWSLGTIFLQIGATGIDPVDANFVRMAFGSALFIPVIFGARYRGKHMPSGRSTKIVLAGSFFGMSLGTLLYTYSVDLIGASVASLLGSTSPLFALPLSIIFLKESYSRKSILGAMLTVFGVVLVVMAA